MEEFRLDVETRESDVTNKERSNALDTRVSAFDSRLANVETHMGVIPKAPPKGFLQKALRWIQHYQILAATSAVLAAFGLYAMHEREDFVLRVDSRIDGKLSGTNGVNSKLESITQQITTIGTTLNTLQPFIQDLVKRQMGAAASLPQARFQANISRIKNVVAAARAQHVAVQAVLVHQISQKLLKVQTRTPDFWQAGADFVSLRSIAEAPEQLRQAGKVLPNCTDSQPTPAKVLSVTPTDTNLNKIKISPGVYENCRITLDSAEDDRRINAILSGSTPNITFKRCLVIYRGGEVNLILAWINRPTNVKFEGLPPGTGTLSGNTLAFENCLFDFSVQAVPPESGQRVTETLLAQNESTLVLPHP